jgi:uncharacterized membrane protein HdeD (DUF308 family)
MELDEQMVAREAGKMWWVFLITGTAWLIISWLVLRFETNPTTSVATVGYLVGAMFLFAAVNEFVSIGATTGGWKIWHGIFGVLFALGSLWGFVHPIDTFFALASVLGFLLFLMGAMEITKAFATKPVNDLWWLNLLVGIFELLLAFWVSQRYYPARASLILLWVGFLALFKGISQIAMAFVVRRAAKDAA